LSAGNSTTRSGIIFARALTVSNKPRTAIPSTSPGHAEVRAELASIGSR
jgi:hypothetical protein